MTNREAYKDKLDEMLAVMIAVVKGKPVPCEDTGDCRECDFYGKCNEKEDVALNWLNAEYQGPTVDWSKVPIDTPVLASIDGKRWYRRYFAGMRGGEPEAYACGATSWSVDDKRTCRWEHLKLAEGNE